MKPEDIILKYYARKKDISKGRTEARFNETVSPCFPADGLGDTTIMTRVFTASGGKVIPKSAGPHFDRVFSAVPGWRGSGNHKPLIVDVAQARLVWNIGAGHLIQRISRLMQLPFEPVPRPSVESKAKRVPGRVVIHCEPGASAIWQSRHFHPTPRVIYPENMEIIRKFARSRRDLEWTTVGLSAVARWAQPIKTLNATDLIDHMATCEWFVGIDSGPMHIATSLGLKCIVIVNFPDPRTIVMPTLKVLGTMNEEWLYPQNVHLHQDGGTRLVPRFSERSLARAFDGDVYPFWKTKWCNLLRS